MFEWITSPEAWVALATLTALEIVLGIDNIIFLSILVGRLPPEQRQSARIIGLGLAMFARIALLLSITWVMRLTEPLFTILGEGITGRELILIGGGLFLLAKSTHEIHHSLEGVESGSGTAGASSYLLVLVQIAIIDIVFSLDSVITAVGLVDQVPVMVIAIVTAVLVMMVSRQGDRRLRRRPPDDKDASPELPHSRGLHADGGGFRDTYTEGLYLHGDGILRLRGDAQYQAEKEECKAGAAAQDHARGDRDGGQLARIRHRLHER